MISEVILKVGIFFFFFKCEVEKSHTPDLAEPFLFCRASGSESPVVISVGFQAALGSVCFAKAFKDTH